MNSINQYGNSLTVPYGQNGYSPYFFGKAYYDAEQILQLIKDVKCELESIEQYQLDKISINYDMVEIINEQNKKDKLI